MKDIIEITKPSITELEISYVEDAVRNGWGKHCYDYINKFQDKFSEYLGVKYSLATSSCTGALHLAFAAIGLEQGDEVIVPELTWIASVAPITYLGAKPVFVDVLSNTWCIDPKRIESAITCKTKAILVVHLYGNLAEMDEIKQIASKHKLILIEDAAESIGSEYKGKKTGSMGDIGVFSFHGTKTMTSGEGGMLVTNDHHIFNNIKSLSDHGRVSAEEKLFYPHFIGYKYKISNLQAAMGYAQVLRAKELVEKKRKVFRWYLEELEKAKVSFNYEQEYAKNSYWMPTFVFNGLTEEDRNKLITNMKKKGIDSRPFFYPLSSLPMFDSKPENKIAYSIYGGGINLPSFFEITRQQVAKVSEILNDELKRVKDEKHN